MSDFVIILRMFLWLLRIAHQRNLVGRRWYLLGNYENFSSHASEVFSWFENTFTFIFTMELTMRFEITRMGTFTNLWMLIECFFVRVTARNCFLRIWEWWFRLFCICEVHHGLHLFHSEILVWDIKTAARILMPQTLSTCIDGDNMYPLLCTELWNYFGTDGRAWWPTFVVTLGGLYRGTRLTLTG